jgi:defect-in-organelle-trafficking protein DotD
MNDMKTSRSDMGAIITLLVALSVTGCATPPPVKPAGPPLPDTEAYAHNIIVKETTEAVQARRDLVAAMAEGQKQILRRQEMFGLDVLDIDYQGPPQPLLEALAYRYGYRYTESGERSHLQDISIHADKRRVLDVLRDLSGQIDTEADVTLDKPNKIIRLDYKRKINGR